MRKFLAIVSSKIFGSLKNASDLNSLRQRIVSGSGFSYRSTVNPWELKGSFLLLRVVIENNRQQNSLNRSNLLMAQEACAQPRLQLRARSSLFLLPHISRMASVTISPMPPALNLKSLIPVKTNVKPPPLQLCSFSLSRPINSGKRRSQILPISYIVYYQLLAFFPSPCKKFLQNLNAIAYPIRF
ncbi:hypothetical protein Zmor_012811 [Zophobas morio]|uniref:Uncharacterized protein n=1 Tax=Zophobas morio TaxID=2755281 RepID=A0AA38IEJ6_9CUCU|nr:hypothetical protein Zmor_012811 [Zophobas morio]